MTHEKVVVVGLGYVGLVVAVAAAEAGHTVIGVDVDQSKIDGLNNFTSHIEDVTEDQLRAVRHRFVATTDPAPYLPNGFDVGVIAVPTPLREKVPDLSYVEAAARTLGRYLYPGSTVILESTTYPGTTEGLLADVLYEVSGMRPGLNGGGYYLGYSPERIDPGNTVNTIKTTPKLVAGVGEQALAKVTEFYNSFVQTTVPVSSPRVAEITKLYENIFAHVNIALVNELSQICWDLGIDVHEMIEAGQTKGHSMYPWYPGPGVGGHCLPIDPVYLSWLSRVHQDRPFRFAELADEVNGRMPEHVVARITQLLNERSLPVNGSRILVLGLAYKPNTGDLRESPALPIVDGLLRLGAEVTVADPHVEHWTRTPVVRAPNVSTVSDLFELVLVVTHHDDFDYAELAETAQQVFDTRHVVPPRKNVVYL